MKPAEIKPEIVFRIINNETNKPTGSYSRACCDEYDFRSVSEARTANVHGTFKDKNKYRIAKYRVTYELIDDNVDRTAQANQDDIPRGQDYPLFKSRK